MREGRGHQAGGGASTYNAPLQPGSTAAVPGPLRCAPQARRLLAAVGGRLVHVYCEAGTRPSYRPYRETSAALMRYVRASCL